MATQSNIDPSAAYISSKGVISRRNQDGTVILMKLDETNFFYKIDGVAAAIWAELETPKKLAMLISHFSSLLPAAAGEMEREVPAFLARLAAKGLIATDPGAEGAFRAEPFVTAEMKGGSYFFGDVKEFNLEQIETEVLNESVYLDVFAGSDLRLKREIEPIQGALDKVMQLQGITYRWNPDTTSQDIADEAIHAGLIAQEVAAVMPELVRRDETRGFLAVEYAKVNCYLVEAVKDLHRLALDQAAKIESLEERLHQLSNR